MVPTETDQDGLIMTNTEIINEHFSMFQDPMDVFLFIIQRDPYGAKFYRTESMLEPSSISDTSFPHVEDIYSDQLKYKMNLIWKKIKARYDSDPRERRSNRIFITFFRNVDTHHIRLFSPVSHISVLVKTITLEPRSFELEKRFRRLIHDKGIFLPKDMILFKGYPELAFRDVKEYIHFDSVCPGEIKYISTPLLTTLFKNESLRNIHPKSSTRKSNTNEDILFSPGISLVINVRYEYARAIFMQEFETTYKEWMRGNVLIESGIYLRIKEVVKNCLFPVFKTTLPLRKSSKRETVTCTVIYAELIECNVPQIVCGTNM